MTENIHPIFDTILQKEDKEKLLGQQGVVVWMTGLSGSGKSTLARAFENELHTRGILTMILDGDNLRSGINNNLTFSTIDRTENTRRAAEVAKLLMNTGVVAICSLISPTHEARELARSIIGAPYFYEIYVNCPFEECAKRDVKGLYRKALNGEIKNFTGLDSPFEPPKNPYIEVKTHENDLETCLNQILDKLIPVISV